MSDIGLIVGSGFGRADFAMTEGVDVDTPFGAPSGPLLTVDVAGCEVAVIARHGQGHTIAPHEVNYRANVWALHEHGVRRCIGINAVGGITAAFKPGELAVPVQLIDYTSGRESTFAGEGVVRHVEFTEPFDALLVGELATAIHDEGLPVHGGVYGVTNGPRLETAAEIDRLDRDGCTMVGMTAMPEAVLAREIGIAYAICAISVNHAAGRSRDGRPMITTLESALELGMSRTRAVLGRWIRHCRSRE
jgi:5'-methylthioinosine phosphorylase